MTVNADGFCERNGDAREMRADGMRAPRMLKKTGGCNGRTESEGECDKGRGKWTFTATGITTGANKSLPSKLTIFPMHGQINARFRLLSI